MSSCTAYLSKSCKAATDFVIASTVFGSVAGLGSGATCWAGRAITHLGFSPGAAIGAVSMICFLAAAIFGKACGLEDGILLMTLSTASAAGGTFGAAYGAVALGLISAPITIPTAALITISSIASVMLAIMASTGCIREESPTPPAS